MAAAFAKRLLDAFVDAGLDRQQCDFDEAAGQMIINNDITRVVPIATLFAQYSLCADEAARSKLVDGAMKAFVEGAADVPSSIAETGDRLLPQLWNKQKIAARQMTLPAGFELPHCGLRGELPLDGDLGVVLVCDYGVDGLSIETPVLSKDLSRWGLSFTAALGKALENLRARTKKGPSADRRWEHHPTGCGESCWKDRFDAVRIAVFPKLVATRKRPDGVAEQGGHVVAFATTSCVLASMSKNALGLCFMGDTLNLQISLRDPKQLLTSIPMRLMKMKDPQSGSARHPLESTASEGMVWRWMPYSPGGPPLQSPGEFSVPVDQGEVDAILEAAENGRAVPVFTQTPKVASAVSAPTFLKMKEQGNSLFKAGEFMKAVSAYNAALREDGVPPADAAVVRSNAAQALLKTAEADPSVCKPLAAEALKRANEAVGLDPTNVKAYARCAAACDLLEEHEAAAEFRQHQARCQAAAEATQQARRAEAEQRRQQQEEQRKKMAAAMEEKARCDALLERERELERRRAKEDAGDLGQAEAARLSSMLGMDSTLAGMPARGVGGN